MTLVVLVLLKSINILSPFPGTAPSRSSFDTPAAAYILLLPIYTGHEPSYVTNTEKAAPYFWTNEFKSIVQKAWA